ncbi:MAG: transposase [Rhodanobacter sp. SCN 68-63]|nr:MAG: transposase [Rhodanobacter sp. SCN 68-63]
MRAFPTTGRSALRRGRVSLPGQVYLITVTTRYRQPVFDDCVAARVASRVIHASTHWGDAQLLAWVLMPDHWHGLLELGHEPLDRVVARFKAAVSRALHASGRLAGPLWDRSFHDHALRRDEDMRSAARYIVGNPVRAGLVDSALLYPYWNAVWLDDSDTPSL